MQSKLATAFCTVPPQPDLFLGCMAYGKTAVRMLSGFFLQKERDMQKGSAEQALPCHAAKAAPVVPQAREKAFIIAA